MKESGLPNWAKTPDSKEPLKQNGETTGIIEEEIVKKEPFSKKRRDSSESANGKRKDSAETKKADAKKVDSAESEKPKVEAKTPQTPVKATETLKKTPLKEKNLEKSPLKSLPSPSKVFRLCP